MKTITSFFASKFLLGAALAGLAVAPLHAQLLATGLPGQRPLGQRAVEVGLATIDPHARGFDRNGTAFGVGFNLPATQAIDFGLHYASGTIRPIGGRLNDWVLGGSLVVHGTGTGMKPFAGATLGYEHRTEKFGPFRVSDDDTVWGCGAGLEIPADALTLTPSVSYQDGTKAHSVGAMHYGVQAATWLRSGLGIFGEIQFSDFASDHGQAWTYRAGLRWKL